NLQFAHQLTKVTLNISYTSQYTGNEVVSALKIVKIPNSTPNSNLIKQAGEGYVPYPFVAGKTLSEVAQQTYTAIVIPGSYYDTGTYSYFLTMTIGDTEVKLKANDFLQTNLALQAGKAYTFNVQVGENQANVSQLSVKAWSGTDPLDEVEPENPYTTVTLVPRADSENGRYFTAWNTNDEVFTTALTADYVKVTGTMPCAQWEDGWYDLHVLFMYSQKLKTLDLSATTATAMSSYSLSQSQSVETIIMPATLTEITEGNFSQCTNLQVVDLSLCTSVPNVDYNYAFDCNGENGENRQVTVYVASGMRNEFLNYCPEGSWTNPWETLEDANRIIIVEKE
ncbi:MAG: fimbrillin family protein, partial [Prevotella sp.]